MKSVRRVVARVEHDIAQYTRNIEARWGLDSIEWHIRWNTIIEIKKGRGS